MGPIHFHVRSIGKTMMTNTAVRNATSNVDTVVKTNHPRRSMPKTLYAIRRRRRQVKTDKIDVKILDCVENHLKFLYVSPNK